MRQFVTALVVVLALGSLASCRKNIHFRTLAKQETVLIQLRTDGGVCKLEQKTPPDIRTESKSLVKWIFIGSCQGGPSVGIRRAVMKEGKGYELFDLNDPETKLEEAVPEQTGPPVILTARLKGDIEKGHYKYQVLINGQPAEFNSPADEGSLFACPDWPCGGFSDY